VGKAGEEHDAARRAAWSFPAAIFLDREVYVEKAFFLRAAITLAIAGSLSGCAGGPSWSSRLAFWRDDEPAGLSATVSPDFAKHYAANQVRPERGDIPEPTGEMPKPQESGWAKFTSAVSGTGSKAVQSVKSVLQPELKAEINPDAGTKSAEWKGLDKPAGSDLYITLAQMMERGGNLEGAARQYELALKSDKDSLPALLGYARLHDRQGKFAEAIVLYERASRAHPKEAAVYNDLALCLSRQGRKEEAAAKMQQAVKLQPERKLYRNNLAKLLVDVNQPDAALEQLSAAHPLGVAHYNLGYLLVQKGDRQRAAKHFARSLELDSSLADARQWLENLHDAAAPSPQSAPAHDRPAPATPYGPAASSSPPPAAGDAGAGPQWVEPQLSPAQGARYQPAAGAMPQVLRPNSLPPGPRYGMAPSRFEPPSQYE
jgi:tetratricopeptide (TPR) repeat protein